MSLQFIKKHLITAVSASYCLMACHVGQGATATTIKWSGLEWDIRNDTGGPGPNTFSSQNVSVDSSGDLHLKIKHNGTSWTCAELYTEKAMAYGTYTFAVDSRVDQLDPNVVLGMFSYPPASVGPDGTNEIDIEFSRWGNPSFPNGNFTVYPTVLTLDNVADTFNFVLDSSLTLNRYIWQAGSIEFQMFQGASPNLADLISRWSTPASFAKQVSTKAMPVHINLWLFQSQPPSDGKPVEIILKSFKFAKGS